MHAVYVHRQILAGNSDGEKNSGSGWKWEGCVNLSVYGAIALGTAAFWYGLATVVRGVLN